MAAGAGRHAVGQLLKDAAAGLTHCCWWPLMQHMVPFSCSASLARQSGLAVERAARSTTVYLTTAML